MTRTVWLWAAMAVSALLVSQVAAVAWVGGNCCTYKEELEQTSGRWIHDRELYPPIHEGEDGGCVVEKSDRLLYLVLNFGICNKDHAPCPVCKSAQIYKPCPQHQTHCYIELHSRCGGSMHTGNAFLCHGCCTHPEGHQ